MNDYPVVRLNGSDTWERGYNLGHQLDEKFPGQEGYDFGYACHYNEDSVPWALIEEYGITGLFCFQVGENDGSDWHWIVGLGAEESYSGRESVHLFHVRGGCDYTGWDCRSSLTWTELAK